MKPNYKSNKRRPPLWASLTIIVLMIAAYQLGLADTLLESLEKWAGPSYTHLPGEGLYVHFLSVGKADSILVIADGQTMLVDAGEAETAQYVMDYIKSAGVKELDAIVATHPHLDHIGAMSYVIEEFSPRLCYISSRTHTTATYERLVRALGTHRVETIIPEPGDIYSLGSAEIEFVGPVKEYENINDCSLVFILEYQGVRVLFAGDAESESENEMVQSGQNLGADVLKVAHHGSNSSSKRAFLLEVMPDYAIITQKDIADSSDRVIERLEEVGAKIYSTDGGEVILSVEGGVLKIEQSKAP